MILAHAAAGKSTRNVVGSIRHDIIFANLGLHGDGKKPLREKPVDRVFFRKKRTSAAA